MSHTDVKDKVAVVTGANSGIGRIATPMVERFAGAAGDARQQLAAMHPVGRLGHVDEVVAAVMFLLSNPRSQPASHCW